MIVILAVVAVALALFIIIPKVWRLSDEKVLTSEDEQYESAAVRFAKNEVIGANDMNVAAYDGIHKSFVDPREAKGIAPYGSNKEHKGKIILVEFDENDDVLLSWHTPEEIAAGQY